jgi:hypothetical protein
MGAYLVGGIMTDTQEVLDSRGERYGQYAPKAEFIQVVKEHMRLSPSWVHMEAHTQEALDMIIHKIGRVIYGDYTHIDNFVDIAGYAELGVCELKGEGR